jgi:hypothetical protein
MGDSRVSDEIRELLENEQDAEYEEASQSCKLIHRSTACSPV